MKIKIKRLTETARLPEYATEGSAGMDLYADCESPMEIVPGATSLVPTGIAIELPASYEAQVRSRSGLAAKNGIFALNAPGTIDSDYRGEVKVILSNFSQYPFTISRGDRVAQMVIARFETAQWLETHELAETERGAGGFGSTGVSAKPKIVFMGTPEFATASLRALHNEFGVHTVVTVPDKPAGRGRKPQPSPVKLAAQELGIDILQPESLKSADFEAQIAEIAPDIICVVAFKILPRSIYTKARLGAFNIHGSILPKYRGAAPINWAIINGDCETGLTSFLLQDKVDTGDMLFVEKVEITSEMTAGDLFQALMPLSESLAVKTCDALISGDYAPLPQPDEQATAAPKLYPENCIIDWAMTAVAIDRLVRGVSPAPGARTALNGKTLKIYRSRLAEVDFDGRETGELFAESKKLFVKCGEGAIEILEIQPEGGKAISARDFLNGFRPDGSVILR